MVIYSNLIQISRSRKSLSQVTSDYFRVDNCNLNIIANRMFFNFIGWQRSHVEDAQSQEEKPGSEMGHQVRYVVSFAALPIIFAFPIWIVNWNMKGIPTGGHGDQKQPLTCGRN